MKIEDALKYIHSVSWRGTIPGLERELELLHRLGDPQRDLFHIKCRIYKSSYQILFSSLKIISVTQFL